MKVETFFEEIDNLSEERQKEGMVNICKALEEYFKYMRENINDFSVLDELTYDLCSFIEEVNNMDGFGTDGLDV